MAKKYHESLHVEMSVYVKENDACLSPTKIAWEDGDRNQMIKYMRGTASSMQRSQLYDR